jgi:hypothetical protein
LDEMGSCNQVEWEACLVYWGYTLRAHPRTGYRSCLHGTACRDYVLSCQRQSMQ